MELKKTQKETLLEMFHRKHTWSNYELRSLQPPIFQVGTRLFELKADGHLITTERDKSDRRKFYYTLHLPGDLFQ